MAFPLSSHHLYVSPLFSGCSITNRSRCSLLQMSLSTSTLWVELAISSTDFTQHPRPGLFAFERICELLHSVVNITRHCASQFRETRRHQYDHSRYYPGNVKVCSFFCCSNDS
ncbi:hypothetical protein FOQG_06124 [Fusarium oxysporum f. sp. raphani 54005]|uniref:Uncharacterized protein n=1 Tax=Fusarium oxysporum f. sp. raphani 54005 TaxID=1089458 RepID=X0CN42_FUSOX|nr:hypothetical protein FOQG_06124 [Fusarium oxysporum f. sp. raphani 54005]